MIGQRPGVGNLPKLGLIAVHMRFLSGVGPQMPDSLWKSCVNLDEALSNPCLTRNRCIPMIKLVFKLEASNSEAQVSTVMA